MGKGGPQVYFCSFTFFTRNEARKGAAFLMSEQGHRDAHKCASALTSAICVISPFIFEVKRRAGALACAPGEDGEGLSPSVLSYFTFLKACAPGDNGEGLSLSTRAFVFHLL
jgi:hypothetical protein